MDSLDQGRTLRSRLASTGLPLIGTGAAIAAWWLATIVFDVRPIILPSPPQVFDAFVRFPDHLARRSWETLWAMLAGFGIASAGGVAVATVLATSRVIERAVLPMMVALNSIPKVALVPLLIFWLGRGVQPKLVLIILICFFPVLVSTMAGLRATSAELAELARSMSASRWQAFTRIRFPWALPHIFVGLKVSMPLAMIGAVVAEISNPNSGLGSVIVRSGASLDTPLAYAAVAILAGMSVALFYLVVYAERLLVPWAREITA